MQKNLKWNAVGMEHKTQLLVERITQDRDNLPKDHLRAFRKFQNFIEELNEILSRIEKIKTELIPHLEKLFRLEFPTPELVYFAMARPSIRNIYEQIHKYFEFQESTPIQPEDFQNLAAAGEAGNVLAFIGDSALDLSVIEYFWDSTVATCGDLTEKRKEVVKNENLAKFCDRNNLFDYRLMKFSTPNDEKIKPETILHEKGTLVEAIYGVVFLEFGFERVAQLIPFIQPSL
ncbi:MAG: ribonuclease III domain-containing protein [Promethearchaeota archaeon]